MPIETVAAPVTAFLASAALSAVLSRYRGRWALLDVPNDRSLHARVTPRSGGLGIVAGLLAGGAITAALPPMWPWLLLALALVATVSFADDLYGLPPLLRLPVHLLAAIVVVFPAGYALADFRLPG